MNGEGRTYQNGSRIFFGKSRSEKRANNNLGVIQEGYGIKGKHFRSEVLKKIDTYLNGNQYDGKKDWDETCYDDAYVKLKDRRPKIIFPFAKVYSDRMSSKLVGKSTFPKFRIEEDEESDYFINKVLIPNSYFKAKMLGVAKDFSLRTSAFVRFKFDDGQLRIIKYNSNYCYPEFDSSGALESVEVKYIYKTEEIDESTGTYIRRWFRLILSKEKDTFFNSPVYKENSEPQWEVEEEIEHKLGFVQGEWFRLGENPHSPDGENNPIIYDMCEFIDALNYNLSQSDSAVNYATEPQLAITGLDAEEQEKLIKSASKTWLLGREGQANFLEISGSGVKSAKEQREDYMKMFQDIARIVFLDPDKMAAQAQSGKAMEVLHGPMVEFINEMRPWFEKGMISLLKKITTTVVLLNLAGVQTQFLVPPRWQPQSLDLRASWPPIFELTTQDKQQLVSIAVQIANANIISRDSALKWIQSQGVDFGIEDYELEFKKVATQPQFNTFGF